jgi:hypothetical protein
LTTAVYSRALNGSGPVQQVELDSRLTTADACDPAGALLYVRVAGQQAEVVRRSGGKAQPQVVARIATPEHTQVSDLAACGDLLAYVVSDDGEDDKGGEESGREDSEGLGGGELTLVKAGTPVLVVEGVDGSTPNGPALSRHWLAFSSYNGPFDGGQWLVDVDDLAAYRLPTAQGLQQVRLTGDWITWREPGRGVRGPHTTVLARLKP